MAKLLAPARDALRERVLEAACAILAAGRVPSERQLRDRIPEHGTHLLIDLRDELIAQGRLQYTPQRDRKRRRYQQNQGLDPRIPREREQILRNRCKVRAEKIARGEVPYGDMTELLERIYRDPSQ